MIVEHRDHFTRVGFRSVETLPELQASASAVVNVAEHEQEDVCAHGVAMVSSFTARLYGQHRAKRQTAHIVQDLQEQEKA